jgi:hypothetical protein
MGTLSDRVMSLSQRMADLQKRLAEVDAERLTIKQEIFAVGEELAATSPAFGASYRTQVLWIMRNEENREFSPLDLSRKLSLTHQGDFNAIRLLLPRLVRAGKVTRVTHGRYRINKGA